jgi:hypothetical protein
MSNIFSGKRDSKGEHIEVRAIRNNKGIILHFPKTIIK